MGKKNVRPLVSVVILSLDNWDYTVRALDTLALTNGVVFETILVDNGSADSVREMITMYNSSDFDFKFLLNDINAGIASGRNQGASIAEGEYILFLDNDVEIIYPDWLKAIVNCLESDSSIGVAGSVLEKPCGGIQFAGGSIDVDGKVVFCESLDPEKMNSSYFCTEFCIGACMVLSKELWHCLNGFDTIFDPMDYEDVDLCLRARQFGKRCAVVTESRLRHKAHTTTGSDGFEKFDRLKNYLINGRRFRKRWKSIFASTGSG